MRARGFIARRGCNDKERWDTADLVAVIRGSGWTWQAAGAIVGLSCGLIAPLIGSAFTAISWVTGPEWNGFSVQRYGTVLLFLTIPHLVLGAYCLDLIDNRDDNLVELSGTKQGEGTGSQTEHISEDDRIQLAVAQETVLRLLR